MIRSWWRSPWNLGRFETYTTILDAGKMQLTLAWPTSSSEPTICWMWGAFAMLSGWYADIFHPHSFSFPVLELTMPGTLKLFTCWTQDCTFMQVFWQGLTDSMCLRSMNGLRMIANSSWADGFSNIFAATLTLLRGFNNYLILLHEADLPCHEHMCAARPNNLSLSQTYVHGMEDPLHQILNPKP